MCLPPRSSRRGSVEIGAGLIADAMKAGKRARPLLYCSHLITGICCVASARIRAPGRVTLRGPGDFSEAIKGSPLEYVDLGWRADSRAPALFAMHNLAAEFTGIRRIEVQT